MLAGLVGGAVAGEGEFQTQFWINPGIHSIHFDRDKNLRDSNIGLGAGARFANDHAAMAGTFINSNRVRSNYAAYLWRPMHWRIAELDGSARIVAGAFVGYRNYRNGAW